MVAVFIIFHNKDSQIKTHFDSTAPNNHNQKQNKWTKTAQFEVKVTIRKKEIEQKHVKFPTWKWELNFTERHSQEEKRQLEVIRETKVSYENKVLKILNYNVLFTYLYMINYINRPNFTCLKWP